MFEVRRSLAVCCMIMYAHMHCPPPLLSSLLTLQNMQLLRLYLHTHVLSISILLDFSYQLCTCVTHGLWYEACE